MALVVVACNSSQSSPSTTPTQAVTPAPTIAPTVPPTLSPSASPPSPSATAVPTVTPTETPAAAALLLEVTQEGGFIAPSARLGQVPTVTVDTAGDIYTADPNSVGPTLIQPVVVRNVGAQGAAAILAAMRAAGLDTETNGGIVADAGVAVFTAEIDGQEIVSRIGAGGGPGGPGGPGASPSPALDLLNRLLDPTETWGAADVANAAFTPAAYKVYAAPAAGAESPTADWPLATDLADFGSPATPDFGVTGLRTGVVFGDDATTLATALGAAAPDTLITSNRKDYQVWVRPLLPSEVQ